MSKNNPNTPPRKETFTEMLTHNITPFYNASIIVQENYFPYKPLYHFSIRYVEALCIIIKKELDGVVKDRHNEARKIGGASHG